MRADVAEPEDIRKLLDTETALQSAWKTRDEAATESAAEHLVNCIAKVLPPRPHPKVRENIEILVVAVAVALAVRTYFVQPFKIPTGSMQPTLHGIIVKPQAERGWMDYFPLSLVRLALFGERYVEVRASVSGELKDQLDVSEDAVYIFVGRTPHVIRPNMALRSSPGYVERGQVLASGRVRLGDHVFVNKVRYNFSRPRRGDIFVFSTDGIVHEQIRPNTFYIKRLVGLPGEEISIDAPYLVANSQRITEPYPFHRLLTDREKGYMGYQLARTSGHRVKLGSPTDIVKLSDSQYLPMGDNTMQSLDGRYFGGVERRNIVGPAFLVYWPFGPRWGLVR
jgi:signal peptidase I